MIFSPIIAQTFHNPIIAGFYPDPSICRVGDDYYLVTSSFEYFPGIPIFHSKDLVHWKQIGYCLSRQSQLPLHKAAASSGIFAPTIRYSNGIFYVVTTNFAQGGNFYVTATDPSGQWSEPIWLNDPGCDPSLFFDDDGTVYYTREDGGEHGSIVQCKIDLKTGKLLGALHTIWRGTGGIYPEGPHLYKINGKYYLMIAEGGTEYGHMETIARSNTPWGPFETDPNNPILSHKDKPDLSIQATGHADLVETPDGWWMVHLGIRPKGGRYHFLGRETFLTKVTWSNDGWPIVEGNEKSEDVMDAPNLIKKTWDADPEKDDFNESTLALSWNFLRNPYPADYSLTARRGFLRLNGSGVTMNDQDSPAFVGQRQKYFNCRVSSRLEFNPQYDNEEAGLVIRGNDKNHFEIAVTRFDGKRSIICRRVLNGKTVELKYNTIPEGAVVFEIMVSDLEYNFYYLQKNRKAQFLMKASTLDLSSEKIGGFTGVYFGIYATGNGIKCSRPADFDWFEIKKNRN